MEEIQVLLRSEANPTQIRELRVRQLAGKRLQHVYLGKLSSPLHVVRAHGPAGESAWYCDPGLRCTCQGYTYYFAMSQLQKLYVQCSSEAWTRGVLSATQVQHVCVWEGVV